MNKPSSNDIAAFPELFDGLEQFIDEQTADIKRTSSWLAALSLCAGALLYYVFTTLA